MWRLKEIDSETSTVIFTEMDFRDKASSLNFVFLLSPHILQSSTCNNLTLPQFSLGLLYCNSNTSENCSGAALAEHCLSIVSCNFLFKLGVILRLPLNVPIIKSSPRISFSSKYLGSFRFSLIYQ